MEGTTSRRRLVVPALVLVAAVAFACSPPAPAGSPKTAQAAQAARAPAPAPRATAEVSAAPSRTSDAIEVVARLVDRGPDAPQCGVLHVVVVMKYEIVKVVDGEYDSDVVYVAHGCPGMPRANYREGAGNLLGFSAGDLHHLSLRKASGEEERSVFDKERGEFPLYLSERADAE